MGSRRAEAERAGPASSYLLSREERKSLAKVASLASGHLHLLTNLVVYFVDRVVTCL
jgi:hypothetical protein